MAPWSLSPLQLRYSAPRNTLVQFSFYQPIRYQWRETDFFPCTVSCGGGRCHKVSRCGSLGRDLGTPGFTENIHPPPPPGYQLNSAECMDTRLKRTMPDQHCHLYPENRKPKPKLRECGSDPCPDRPVSLSAHCHTQY